MKSVFKIRETQLEQQISRVKYQTKGMMDNISRPGEMSRLINLAFVN